ncbi:hypothetical protein CPS_3272 [Colwellia psychrerythraea 34H]|uniref:Uncharacterized protein n=1 Tax=Colwellia psychrerythraea (strain 34H / ATCC BAA-681) TaxID=167879 RepID=Q47Z16_COLP3|nr:hypothetical protein CPS_3272 [Colwellia psychrerythraea 34H]
MVLITIRAYYFSANYLINLFDHFYKQHTLVELHYLI